MDQAMTAVRNGLIIVNDVVADTKIIDVVAFTDLLDLITGAGYIDIIVDGSITVGEVNGDAFIDVRTLHFSTLADWTAK